MSGAAHVHRRLAEKAFKKRRARGVDEGTFAFPLVQLDMGHNERGAARMDDRTSVASMERRKREGYF